MFTNSSGPFRLRHSLLCGIGLAIMVLFSTVLSGQQAWDGNATPTWEEAIAAFQTLAGRDPRCAMQAFGTADVGRPLHLFTMGAPDAGLRILVNNAIHPGEPCGVNASLQWAESLLQDVEGLPEGVLIGIVPMYNVGGGLRRNCCTRANQMGPEEYGFRGNARNLDLNRDFIKCDSRNALAFSEMFTRFGPDIFVDTHTSNGADYQPAMTLISTQTDKLGGPLGDWVEHAFNPLLFAGMEAAGEPMIPYVNTLGATPDEGIADFLETPRYSTGYAALHHTIGYTTEAHMLKPFPRRVQATRTFLDVVLNQAIIAADTIALLRALQHASFLEQDKAAVAWTLDTTSVDSLWFPGFEARYEWSNVTGNRRLRYDRASPYHKPVPHFHTFAPSRWAPIPEAYVVPQAWRHVVERLSANNVAMRPIPRDTVLQLEVVKVLAHSAASRPYEGHHYRNVEQVVRSMEDVPLFAGDYIVPVDQAAARYLVEVLSPEAVDAFMAWNFFDSALQQKEYFSPYVFEETAAAMLASDPELRAAFEAEKDKSQETGETGWSPRQQLDWLYKRSPHFEGTSTRYPVFAIPAGQAIPAP